MGDVAIESHTESSPSLRIDKPFPALLQAARAFDFDAMDSTDHGHIPYVYILVRALDDWKTAVRCFHPHGMPFFKRMSMPSTMVCLPRLTRKSKNSSQF